MILFLLSLIIIILMHEASHLIVAKKCGCKVDEFSLGFGRAIYSKKIKGTTYKISPLLLGGYCKLRGELAETRSKYAFINLPYRKKFAISIAGCATNMIIGLLSVMLGIIFHNYYLMYFGNISFLLGATNWVLPVPCLDGGYALWFPILTFIYGKKKGLKIFARAVKISFIIVMILNILCIPLLIALLKKGAL